MNVQILLGYLQPIHHGDQSHLILGLDNHQPSPQTPFVSYVYFDKTKQGCLSLSHDSLSTSNSWHTQIHVAWNVLERSHVFISDVAWTILGQRVCWHFSH